MTSTNRFLGLALLLLLGFVGAAFVVQGWLQEQTRRIREDAIAAQQRRLEAALEVLSPAGGTWEDQRQGQLEELLGASVTPLAAVTEPDIPPEASPQNLTFDYPLPAGAGPAALRVTFPIPAASRLILVNQRLVLVLMLLGPAVLALLAAAFLFGTVRPGRGGTLAAENAATHAEMGSLLHLARTSVARGEALDRERDERRRAEEDAQLNQRLLNQALEERIRLGRDLHDRIIQSLYAVGLTLESVRSQSASDPVEANRRLGQCLDQLNATIREVRAYIAGLAPETLRHTGFDRALKVLVAELRGSRDIAFDLRIDADAAAALSPAQSADLLQIASEAISNSVRHGMPNRITIRLHRSDHEVCLLVQDDGSGFDASRQSTGHGLGNMRARAAALGARLEIESEPHQGTRLLLTVSSLQPA